MKRILFLFLFIHNLIVAQTYIPFISTPDSSDTWMDLSSCTDLDCYNTFTNRFTIEGDTTIGGQQYAKFYIKTKHEEGGDQNQGCVQSISYYEYYFGAVRESGKKIYVLPDNFNPTEYLAYDFNLTLGDTMPSPDGTSLNPSGRIINDIDSVFVLGSYRKRYLVNANKYVIEGIGGSTGLFHPLDFNASFCDFSMLCYAENSIPDYFLLNCEMNLDVNNLITEEKPAELIKIVDYLGRETELKPNTLLIYVYSDGSSKRVYIFE